MDRLVFTWGTLFTATNDTFDSFHVACNSISERYLPFSFFLQENGAVPCLAMSYYE